MISFHTLICMLEWIACIVGFICGLVKPKWWPPLWYISLIMWLAFPIVNEVFLIFKGRIFRYRVKNSNYSERHNLRNCAPIVYHPDYNMTFCGLEKLHPFDSIKYQRAWAQL